MTDYRYELLNYWNDNNDLYVDYIITNNKTLEEAHACILLNANDIDEYEARTNIDDDLIKMISKRNGLEFTLHKTSELNKVTYDIFKDLCNSENNMIYISKMKKILSIMI